MNKLNYHEKSFELLNICQFTKLNLDPTKIEAKILGVLRKIKANLTSHKHLRLYPTGSCPRLFYGKNL